ncbi:MAG: hypothetical protein AAFY99_09320 [Pseudomonadota bacterium]
MLQYVVDQHLAGHGARIKGFTIAQDVFGKSDDFDPAMDAVVRVQAGRLRDQLKTYYENEGSDNSLRISIPRGTYVPVFHSAPTLSAVQGDAEISDSTWSTEGRLSGDAQLQLPINSFIVANVRGFRVLLISILVLLLIILILLWRATGMAPGA